MRALLFLLGLLLAGVALVRHLERTRPQDLPWTPLDLTAPIGAATRVKLQALARDPARCRDLLARAGVAFTSVPDRGAGACGYRDAVRLQRSSIAYAPQPLQMSCPMAAALVIWERQVVTPAAMTHVGTRVRRIDHYGTYSCRRLYGASTGPWSEHATANALDVAAFRFTDGQTATVLRHWDAPDARSAFLQAAHEGACRLFGTTLGPAYNAAHADHFHLDMRLAMSCR
jgi:hypothetical protein